MRVYKVLKQESDMNLLLFCQKKSYFVTSLCSHICLTLSLVSIGYIQSPHTSFLWQRLYHFSVDTHPSAEKPDPGKC